MIKILQSVLLFFVATITHGYNTDLAIVPHKYEEMGKYYNFASNVEQEFKNGTWMNTEKESYIYELSDLPISRVTETWDTLLNTWTHSETKKYFWNSMGQLLSVYEVNQNSDTADALSKSIFYHNNIFGKISEEQYFTKDSSFWVPKLKNIYTYTISGLLKTEESQSWMLGKWALGKITKEFTYLNDTSYSVINNDYNLMWRTKKDFTYANHRDQLYYEEFTDPQFIGNWLLVQTFQSYYGLSGELDSAIGRAFEGEWGNVVKMIKTNEYIVDSMKVNFLIMENSDSGWYNSNKFNFMFVLAKGTPIKQRMLIDDIKNSLEMFPNPFNSSIKISYPNTKNFKSLSIFNSKGQIIKTLSKQSKIWDGLNNNGHKVPSGIYLIQLKANGQVYNRRVSLVR